MNDYERRRAEELAVQRYPNLGKPGERALARRAFIEGYEAALETVAPEPQHGQTGYPTGNGFGHG